MKVINMSAQKNVNKNSLGAMKSSPAKQKGASAIEYVVIAALVVVALVAAVGFLDLEGIFTDVNTKISSEMGLD